MTNLDKLLLKVEKNIANKDKTETKEIFVGGETYELTSLSRSDKKKLFYSKQLQGDNSLGDMVKWLKPYIYKSLQLQGLALKAKEQGLISSYYDIIEALFEPTELMEVITAILDFNGLQDGANIEEDIEELKKS